MPSGRYSASGRLVSIADRYGNTVTLTYAGDRLKTIRAASDQTLELTDSADGRLASLTDWAGRTVAYDYADGDRTHDPAAAGGDDDSVAYEYDYSDGQDPRAHHNLVTVREVGGASELAVRYGSSGPERHRVVQQVFEGGTYALAYMRTGTASSSAVRLTDRRGTVTEHSFDDAGRMVRLAVLDEAGAPAAMTNYEYGESGLVTRVVMPRGNTIEYVYDGASDDPLRRTNLLAVRRRPSATSVDAVEQSYSYGPFNQVTGVTDERGSTTDFDVDNAGNVTAIRAPAIPVAGGGSVCPTITCSFDTHGQLVERRHPNGLVVRFQYDARGRLTREEQDGHGTQRVARWAYDSDGALVEERMPTGAVRRWRRDGRGRPVELESNGRVTRRWDYDAYDRSAAHARPPTDSTGSRSIPNGSTRRSTGTSRSPRGEPCGGWRDGRRAARYRYDAEGNVLV